MIKGRKAQDRQLGQDNLIDHRGPPHLIWPGWSGRSARAPSSSGVTTLRVRRSSVCWQHSGSGRDSQRKALEELQHSCDPVALLATVRRCQASLASLSAGQAHQEQRPRTGAVDPEQASKEQRTLSRFLRNLQLFWQESQPLPEPRQKRRYKSRQRTLFLEHREQIEQWLERETGMTAAEILRRQIRLAPGTYHEGLRSMERHVKK